MKKTSIGNKHIATPYVVWSAIFVIVPMLMVGYYSFTDESGRFTLANITKVVEFNYLKIFGVSILYALIATVICLLISYPLAYFMTKTKLSTQGTLLLLVMLPMWMNLLIRTYSLSNILPAKTKSNIIDIPVTISGFIIGMFVTVITAFFVHFFLYAEIPTAAAEPSTVAIRAEETARTRVFIRAFRTVLFEKSSVYQ